MRLFFSKHFSSVSSTTKSTTKGVAKYANPADPNQTWTGRGRQPAWVKQALAEGKDLSSMAI